MQLLDGVVQTPRQLETSALRETIPQKIQEAERANSCVDRLAGRTAHFFAVRRCASKPHYKLRASPSS